MDGAVVVVHADREVQRSIETALEEVGAEAVVCPTARRGLNACCALEPICLVTEARPTDFDACWLASAIRAQPPAVAAIPILVLVADGQEPNAEDLLAAGADVVVSWPVQARELVARVAALVAMAARIRDRAASSTLRPPQPPVPSSHPPRAFSGSLDRVAVATVLALLELDRATGTLSLARTSAGKNRLVLDLASGGVVGGMVGTNQLRPLEAVDAAVHWGPGRFEFVPSAPKPLADSGVALTKLLRAVIGAGDAVEIDEPPTRPKPDVKKAPPARPAPHASGTQTRVDPVDPGKGERTYPRFSSTLVSAPAVEPPGPPAPKRRASERMRAAIKVEAPAAPPRARPTRSRPPSPRTEPDDDDVIEAENEASPRRRR